MATATARPEIRTAPAPLAAPRPLWDRPLVCVALLTLWCGGLFFYGIDACDLWRNEGLRALIAAGFLDSGNWVVPTLYGEPLFTKPPGAYALIALVSWPFGAVSTVNVAARADGNRAVASVTSPNGKLHRAMAAYIPGGLVNRGSP